MIARQRDGVFERFRARWNKSSFQIFAESQGFVYLIWDWDLHTSTKIPQAIATAKRHLFLLLLESGVNSKKQTPTIFQPVTEYLEGRPYDGTCSRTR
jgi:hypothetical protein